MAHTDMPLTPAQRRQVRLNLFRAVLVLLCLCGGIAWRIWEGMR